MPVSGIDSVIKGAAAQEYWVERLVAFVIDAVIVYLRVGLVVTAFALPSYFIGGIASVAAIFAGFFSFVAGMAPVLYFSVLEAVAGASFGKRMMGLTVWSKGGQDPNSVEALIRNVSKTYWLLLLLDLIIGLATSKEYTQKFSDRFAGTSVVKRRVSHASA